MAEDSSSAASIAALITELQGSGRRRRQEVAHKLAAVAKTNPALLVGHMDELIATLERPEAQTRWEILTGLTELCAGHADKLAGAFEGAEESLFDDDSATVRLAAFIFLCRYGATSAKRSDVAWPLLDEAIQCYHGDAEYRDMLSALLELARGKASKATKAALSERVSFDADNGSGYVKTFSQQIVEACK
ncbi:hypothetical protein [Paratractidigestivibacter sp.]|uniref:hypothetical protein n=1 Tax=Paratractidigestivibacter sp. TaxID=2847316 RepID=UPI002AC95164|nr:hypothetical protein [Paratractidigestivibacter sp.]